MTFYMSHGACALVVQMLYERAITASAAVIVAITFDWSQP